MKPLSQEVLLPLFRGCDPLGREDLAALLFEFVVVTPFQSISVLIEIVKPLVVFLDAFLFQIPAENLGNVSHLCIVGSDGAFQTLL